MKKLILSVLAALGFAAANAGGIFDTYTPLKYLSSETSGRPWASNKVGPYTQIYNLDKSPFVLGADDVVETKFRFNEANEGACVFCDRTSGSAGKFVLMRTGNTGNPGRFDYGTENNTFESPSLANTSVHTVVASGTSLKIDGTSVEVKSSTYVPSSNALLVFCCDNSGNGIANSGNKGTITMYYFRVKDGSGNLRLNLVPMLRVADSKPGFYDTVSGQFFMNKSVNGEFTYEKATGFMDFLAAATTLNGATDPAAEGGDYVFKDGNDYVHVFTSVGESKTLAVTEGRTAQILVIGGGGAGGNNCGAGGGAGGFVYTDTASVAANTAYAVTVGAGGRTGTPSDPLFNHGLPGENSSFVGGGLSITAIGGGGGGCFSGVVERMCGGNGGSGGGATGGDATHTIGLGTPGQGSNGGAGYKGAMAGGGGGAGAAGATPKNETVGGAGGDGRESLILGWPQYFAGGGAGCGGQVNQIAEGGRGGGGNSSKRGGLSTAGENGLGGGGGGGCNTDNTTDVAGANGGSGIVIIRLSKIKVEISGEISMPDWTEGETESEPTGLTVTPSEAASSFAYKYYANADCTEAIDKPSTMGVYYVRGEVAESDSWGSAVSAAAEFKIRPAGGGKDIVTVPTITTELTYTGEELSPVEPGEHYRLTGDAVKTLAGNYMATLELEDTEKYIWSDTLESDPKGINWTITQAVNKWTVEPSIDKTVWKSTETPGKVTPPVAQFGEPKAQIAKMVNGEYADWTDWDGETMPAEKGKYKIRWQVAELEGGYTALESEIEFLIDYRYNPTHPFMVSTDGEKTWVGKATIDDACKAASGGNIIIEVCEDISVSALSSSLGYKTVTIRSNLDEESTRTITVTANASFGIYNGGKLILSNVAFNLLPSANISKFASLGINANSMGGTLEVQEKVEFFGKVTGPLIQNENGNDGKLYAHLTINGGTIKDLTAGYSLISAPGDASFSVKNLTIENCTVANGALIAVGNKTLNLSDVTIVNNTTTAGAITVNYVNELTNGVIKVSGDVIVKNNKAQEVEKNIVLKNAANLQMVGDLGAGASVGVSYGLAGDQFGVYVGGDAKTAAKFFNDAKPALMGKARNDILSWTGAGLMLLIK